MKINLYTLFLIIITITFGCSRPEKIADTNQLIVKKDGLIYMKGKYLPYTGKSRSYYANGNLEGEEIMLNGKLHGLIKSYYENGKMETKFMYQNGIMQDTAFYFYESGNIMNIIILDGTGKSGIETKYYENGNRLAEGQTITGDTDGIKNGQWVNYYPNGAKRSIEIYEYGALIDSAFLYYQNGQIKGKGFYKQGLKHGTFDLYDSITGEINASQIFSNDSLIANIFL